MGLITPKGLCYQRAVPLPIVLKSCPFCGDEGILESGQVLFREVFFIRCVKCSSRTKYIFVENDTCYDRLRAQVKACYTWNLRTPEESERTRKQEKEIDKLVNSIIKEEQKRKLEAEQGE